MVDLGTLGVLYDYIEYIANNTHERDTTDVERSFKTGHQRYALKSRPPSATFVVILIA